MDGIEAKPYNFYTFPRPFKGKFCRDIGIEPDCVEFHKRVGTDFQKWIIDGVAYYDEYTLKKLKNSFFPEKADKIEIKSKMSRDDDIVKMDKFKTNFDEWNSGDQKVIIFVGLWLTFWIEL